MCVRKLFFSYCFVSSFCLIFLSIVFFFLYQKLRDLLVSESFFNALKFRDRKFGMKKRVQRLKQPNVSRKSVPLATSRQSCSYNLVLYACSRCTFSTMILNLYNIVHTMFIFSAQNNNNNNNSKNWNQFYLLRTKKGGGEGVKHMAGVATKPV